MLFLAPYDNQQNGKNQTGIFGCHYVPWSPIMFSLMVC